MESLTLRSAYLRSLRRKAAELTSAGESLASLLADEAIRLSRKDEASRLMALHASISRQLKEATSREDSARFVNTRVRATTSWAGLAAGVFIKMVSKDERVQAFSNHLLNNLGGEKLPFGTVLVGIGPKGLPDDVEVIPVSQLARELKRNESEIIDELKKHGHLLATEHSFSLLIHRLINDVEKGRLLLPISTETLSKLKGPPCSKPQDGEPVWERCYWL